MAVDQELSELTAVANLATTDILYLVRDPGGAGEADHKFAVSVMDARYQPLDADLTTIAGLAKADGNFIVGDGAAWIAESGAVARASLGLGSLATVNDAPVDGSQYTRQNGAWAAIAALPVVDETALVYKTGTPASTLTFDVTAYTAARVVTWPNAALTVAGLEVANIFSASQTVQRSVATSATTLATFSNTNTTNGGAVVILKGYWNETNTAFGANRNGGLVILQNRDATNGNYSAFLFRGSSDQTSCALYGINKTQGGEGAAEGEFAFNVRNTAQNVFEAMRLNYQGRLGVNVITGHAGKVHIDQSSTTGAIPVLLLDQADVSEEFIRLIGTSANAVLTQSIVEAADVATFTPVGYLKIYVQDDGNQVADGAYYLQFGTIA